MLRTIRRSLFARLLLSYTALVLLSLLVTGTLSSRLFMAYYVKSKQRELLERAAVVSKTASEIGPAVLGDIRWLAATERFLEARLLIVDGQGKVIVSVSSEAPVGSELLPEDRIVVGLKGQLLNDGDFVVKFREPTLSVLAPFQAFPLRTHYLVVSTPVSDIMTTAAAVKRVLLYAGGGSILIAALAAYCLSNSISRPLRQMTSVAKEMTKNNFTQKVNVAAEDEIGQLGESINIMAESLDHTIRDLAEEKAKIEKVIANMSEGVLAVDGEGCVVLANGVANRDLGVALGDDMLGEDVPARRVAVAELVREVLSTGTGSSMEFTCEHRHLVAHGAPLTFGPDRSGAVVVLQDITRHVEAESLRTELLADLSHELKTPLSSIQGFAEGLRDDVVKDEATRRSFVDTIYSETIRLRGLVESMLDLTLLQSHKAEWPVEPVHIGSLVSQVANEFGANADRIEVRLSEGEGEGGPVPGEGPQHHDMSPVPGNSPNAGPQVLVNAERIAQVLGNLLDNALKYSPDTSPVIVAVETVDGEVRISVTDNGPGISPEHLPRIWERFYRVDKSRSRALGGVGLGLSIAKEIIEAHHGRIWVESEVGRGSVFTFALPVV